MAKEFNVTGKCIPTVHYMADISSKLTETLQLAEKGKYFIINRPRQYGKTTMLHTIGNTLRQRGYLALNLSFEGLDEHFFRTDRNFSNGFMLLLAKYATVYAPELVTWLEQSAPKIPNLDKLDALLTQFVQRAGKKVVLLIDEVDQSSNFDVFIKFLALLRNKYLERDTFDTFHSVILAGVHDVKTLKLKMRPDAQQKYNSPWNIATDFKVDMNLYPHEIKPMLDEYVQATGVIMDTMDMSYALFYYTSGYPFLVSRLCKILDEEGLLLKKERSWTKEDLFWAAKRLIKENNTNFDTQIKNLENNPDLHQLVYSIAIDGETRTFNAHNPVTHLALIYGLLVEKNNRLAIHNRVYNELIINYMTSKIELSPFQKRLDVGGPYRNDDNSLNMQTVLLNFQAFMRQHYERKERDFIEKNARLIFLAFLRPIINGAGYDFKEAQISDEKRLDVVITYYEFKYIVELKIWRGEQAHQRGLTQLTNYLNEQLLNEGFLLIFDHAKVKNWATETVMVHGKEIFMVWV